MLGKVFLKQRKITPENPRNKKGVKEVKTRGKRIWGEINNNKSTVLKKL